MGRNSGNFAKSLLLTVPLLLLSGDAAQNTAREVFQVFSAKSPKKNISLSQPPQNPITTNVDTTIKYDKLTASDTAKIQEAFPTQEHFRQLRMDYLQIFRGLQRAGDYRIAAIEYDKLIKKCQERGILDENFYISHRENISEEYRTGLKTVLAILQNRGICYYQEGDITAILLQDVVLLIDEALEIDKPRAHKSAQFLGNIFFNTGSYDLAVKYYQELIDDVVGSEHMRDKILLSESVTNLALTQLYILESEEEQLTLPEEVLQKLLLAIQFKLYLSKKNIEETTLQNNQWSDIMSKIQTSKPLENWSTEQLIEIIGGVRESCKETNDIDRKGLSIGLLGVVDYLLYQGKYEQANELLVLVYDIKKTIGDSEGMLAVDIARAKLLVESSKNYSEAVELMKEVLAHSQNSGLTKYSFLALKVMLQGFDQLEENQSKQYDPSERIAYQELYINFLEQQDKARSHNNVLVQNMHNRRKMIKDNEERLIREHKKEIENRQGYTNGATILAIGVVVALLAYGYDRNRRRKKLQRERDKAEELRLKAQQAKIESDEQRKIAQIATGQITSSINYAQRIQQSMLPPQEVLSDYFSENFIFYQPKDTVSGDFYWIKEQRGKIAIGCFDCTGHGVPGGFMSMIGSTTLTHEMDKQQDMNPGKILQSTDIGIRNMLGQDTNNTDLGDGMNGQLCIYDPATKQLKFAGAESSLYIISNGDLEIIKGNRVPVGGSKEVKGGTKNFDTHEISLQSGDTVYMFSDGFRDQFGGPDNKKYLAKNFKNTLLQVNKLDGEEQKQYLEEEFAKRKGNYEQIDDVLVMGLKV